MIVRTLQNDVVDALCWRHYGRTQGAMEMVIEANSGLAVRGPILPMGLEIEMPDITRTPLTARLLNIFD